MRRRSITLIAVGAVLVIVIGVILYLQYRPEPEVEVAEDPDKVKISRFDKDLIAEMILENEHGTLRIWREDEEWKVDYPHSVKLKESNVEDVAYSFASLYSEKIVEEEPEDIAKYGLEPPLATARYVLTDGSSREFYLGNKTPAGNTYYLMAQDDPKVYAVWMNHGSHFQYKLDDLRDKDRGQIDNQQLTYVRIERRGEPPFEMQHKTSVPEDEVRFTMGSFVVTEPYREPQPIDADNYPEYIQDISAVKIDEFIDDDPEDLSVYGLDPPEAEYIARDAEGGEAHLLFGKKVDDKIYFMEAGGTSVYTTRDYYTGFLDVNPFFMIDKFAFIVNIEDVDAVRIEGLGGKYVLRIERKPAEEEGEEPETTYLFNDREVEEKPFKQLYQSIIEPQLDTDYEGRMAENPEVQIVYTFNKENVSGYRVSFVPYDPDFYALFRGGSSEFLVSREQVQNLMKALEDFDKDTGSG